MDASDLRGFSVKKAPCHNLRLLKKEQFPKQVMSLPQLSSLSPFSLCLSLFHYLSIRCRFKTQYHKCRNSKVSEKLEALTVSFHLHCSRSTVWPNLEVFSCFRLLCIKWRPFNQHRPWNALMGTSDAQGYCIFPHYLGFLLYPELYTERCMRSSADHHGMEHDAQENMTECQSSFCIAVISSNK